MRCRALVLAPATVLLALALLAGCGSEEGEDPVPSAATTAAEPTPTEDEGAGEAEADRKDRDRPTEPAEPEPDLAVTVSGGEITPNAQELQVAVGEPVTVAVQSDRAGELHVHSTPEQYVEFGPGRTTQELVFGTPGSIEVEEHDSGAVVAFVEAR